MTKVLIAAGGTGGHVFPAIAVAQAIRAKDPAAQIIFVGSSHGPEKAWVENAGFDFRAMEVRFLTGASLVQKLRRVALLFKSALQSLKILREERPDVVLGSGGYVSGPMLAMARLKGYRTGIMEQNAIPGFTNRILGRFVHEIYVSFDVAYPFKPSKIKLLGNPVRSMPEVVAQEAAPDTLRLFVFGGSQGASSLNTGVPKALRSMSAQEQAHIEVVHQCGRNKEEETHGAYEGVGVKHSIHAFIDNMGARYGWADILVCRAGATSIAEIQCMAKPAILVPFPFAAHQHQDKNADAMVEHGAAWKLPNDEVEEGLAPILRAVLADRALLSEKAQKAQAMAKPNAAVDVAKAVLALAGKDHKDS